MKNRYDERHTIFSRVKLVKGTPNYEAFYKDNRDYKEKDDALRDVDFRQNLRESEHFKQLFFPLTSQNTILLKALHDAVDQTPLAARVDVPEKFHENIKAISRYFGAVDVGIVKLKEDHYYSHGGGVSTTLGIDNYGDPIRPSYTTAIVYLILMDINHINRAPHFEALLETEGTYLDVAYTGSRLALYLKGLGYKSVFQSEAFYLTPLVPLAYDAGLGEIGMTNHLVHPKYGDRVRIGAVMTTLDLKPDAPIDFGLTEFCRRCALCLMNCPSKSITPHTREVNGRMFYKFDDQSCFKLWQNSGTDCGTCLQSCPFTQGIDEDTIESMKGNPVLIDKAIQQHLQKHTRRRYTKKPLKIIRLEESS